MTCDGCGEQLETEHRCTFTLDRALHVGGEQLARFAPSEVVLSLCNGCADRTRGAVVELLAEAAPYREAPLLAEVAS